MHPILLAACLVALAAAARAQGNGPARGVRLVLEAPLPFSASEIEEAVRARVALDPDGDVVVLRAAAEGGVVVRVGDKARTVAVVARRGGAAARVVALVIVDLTAQELTPEPASAPPAAPSAAAIPTERLVAQASLPPTRPALRLGVVGGATKGLGSEEPACLAGEIDATMAPGGGASLLGAALGAVTLPTQRPGLADEVWFASATLRLFAGRRIGNFDLTAGPFVAPYAIGGVTTHHGVLAGGTGTARLAAALNRRWHLVIQLRVDGFANRVHASWAPGDAFATPRVAVAAAAGLAWDLGL